jgi:hypothetical protein
MREFVTHRGYRAKTAEPGSADNLPAKNRDKTTAAAIAKELHLEC